MDIVVNNAGHSWDNVIQKMSGEQWHAMLDSHLTAPFRILRAAQPVIRRLVKAEADDGRRAVRKIVNVSSIAGLFGNSGQTNYSAGKAGIVGMTMTPAKEWGRLNTTVNCVAFGFVETRLTAASADEGATANIEDREIGTGFSKELKQAPERSLLLGRAGTADDAAGSVHLLCAPESDYVSGQTLMCSGGADRHLNRQPCICGDTAIPVRAPSPAGCQTASAETRADDNWRTFDRAANDMRSNQGGGQIKRWKADHIMRNEPPRDSRRPLHLRRWSQDASVEVFSGSNQFDG
nr:SDR family oxidoreductase [Solimonas terrae]